MTRKRKQSANMQFSKTLRSLMKEKNMTVRQAAQLAEVSPSTLEDWRSGTAPSDYMAVKRLARALGVSFSFLLTGDEDDKAENISPSITEVFEDGGSLFDGYAKITIQRLIPRDKSFQKKEVT